jgi:hypothetical protein
MREQVRIDRYELGERALQTTDATRHPIDFIARTEDCDSRPNLFDSPSHVKTEHSGKSLLSMCCVARADFRIKRIHATGRDPDQNLIRSDFRARDFYLPKLSARPFHQPNTLHHLQVMMRQVKTSMRQD